MFSRIDFSENVKKKISGSDPHNKQIMKNIISDRINAVLKESAQDVFRNVFDQWQIDSVIASMRITNLEESGADYFLDELSILPIDIGFGLQMFGDSILSNEILTKLNRNNSQLFDGFEHDVQNDFSDYLQNGFWDDVQKKCVNIKR